MVLCVVIGCSKRSERDKDVSFYRIPAIIKHTDKRNYELSKKRREGFFAAISREDVDFINVQHYRICSRHSNSASLRKVLMILLIQTSYQHRISDMLKSRKVLARLIFLDTKELKEVPRRVHRRNKRIFCCINKQKW